MNFNTRFSRRILHLAWRKFGWHDGCFLFHILAREDFLPIKIMVDDVQEIGCRSVFKNTYMKLIRAKIAGRNGT